LTVTALRNEETCNNEDYSDGPCGPPGF